jgi:Flp pilus assembly protein TadG
MLFLRRRSKQRSKGQALVETALVLPILVLLLLLAVDLGRIFFTTIELRNAAHEASMYGGTNPTSLCTDLKPFVDREMGTVTPNDAVCGALGPASGRVYITDWACEDYGNAPPRACGETPYPAQAKLLYKVRLDYRFQPVVPFVGALTGNGVGGSIAIHIENRSPVLVGYGN